MLLTELSYQGCFAEEGTGISNSLNSFNFYNSSDDLIL